MIFSYIRLSEADHKAINNQRDAHTRLGFALQLCALRYLGFAPDNLSTAPWDVVVYVARQLHVPPKSIETYGNRIPTRTEHLQFVQVHLGFRKALPLDFYALQTWLIDRALEHGVPAAIAVMPCSG
jgi:TnpA family transposase